MLVGCLQALSAHTANVRPGPTVQGVPSGWGSLPACMPGLDT